jgi:hypothetical protein
MWLCMHAGGPQKKRAVKVTGDSRVFEEGQLGEAPGGGRISTYRELCSLATEMGQPDLLYKFMDLANHASALASSRGAAFGCCCRRARLLCCLAVPPTIACTLRARFHVFQLYLAFSSCHKGLGAW